MDDGTASRKLGTRFGQTALRDITKFCKLRWPHHRHSLGQDGLNGSYLDSSVPLDDKVSL